MEKEVESFLKVEVFFLFSCGTRVNVMYLTMMQWKQEKKRMNGDEEGKGNVYCVKSNEYFSQFFVWNRCYFLSLLLFIFQSEREISVRVKSS